MQYEALSTSVCSSMKFFSTAFFTAGAFALLTGFGSALQIQANLRGRTYSIDVPAGTTVRDFKQIVTEDFDLPADGFRIFSRGRSLDDDVNMAEVLRRTGHESVWIVMKPRVQNGN